MLETRACDNYWNCTKRLDNTHVPARLSSNHTMDCEQKHDEFGRTSENLDKLKAHPRSTGRKRARDPSVRPGWPAPQLTCVPSHRHSFAGFDRSESPHSVVTAARNKHPASQQSRRPPLPLAVQGGKPHNLRSDY